MSGAMLYSSKVPWQITAYAGGDCSGDPVLKAGPDDNAACISSSVKFSSWSLLPLWNAQYRAFNMSFTMSGHQPAVARGRTGSTGMTKVFPI